MSSTSKVLLTTCYSLILSNSPITKAVSRVFVYVFVLFYLLVSPIFQETHDVRCGPCEEDRVDNGDGATVTILPGCASGR